MFELCERKKAFPGDTLLAVAHSIDKNLKTLQIRDYKRELKELILKGLLHENPSSRPELTSIITLPFLAASISKASER